MTKVAFIGSFNPITIGHKDIISRASKLFDKVDVVIMNNADKQNCIDVSLRKKLIDKCVKTFDNITVNIWEGLAVDYCSKNDVNAIIRGVRNSNDVDYELNISWTNMKLANVETIFLPVSADLVCVSSSVVREVLSYNGDISMFVPAEIVNDTQNIYKGKN